MASTHHSLKAVRRYDCKSCDDARKKRRNCDGKGNPHYREVLGTGDAAVICHRCPLSMVTPFDAWARKHFLRYTAQGVLPRAGGTDAQDARLMRAIDVLTSQVNAIEQAESDRP